MREPMRGLGSGYLMSPSLLSSCLATCYRVLYNKSRGADLRADAGTTTGPDAFNDFIVSADHALHLAKKNQVMASNLKIRPVSLGQTERLRSISSFPSHIKSPE